jgi:hypothetical protein
MAYLKFALLAAMAVVGEGSLGVVNANADAVPCVGAKAVGDTIAIVTDRKTGAREQSLVEARLGVVARGKVVGLLYVDDEGQRYVERRAGATIAGLEYVRSDGKVYAVPMQQIFGGEARLRACRADSR